MPASISSRLVQMILAGTMGKTGDKKEFIKELQIEQLQGERSVANGQS